MFVPQDGDEQGGGEMNLGFGSRDAIQRSLHQLPPNQQCFHQNQISDILTNNLCLTNNFNRY